MLEMPKLVSVLQRSEKLKKTANSDQTVISFTSTTQSDSGL